MDPASGGDTPHEVFFYQKVSSVEWFIVVTAGVPVHFNGIPRNYSLATGMQLPKQLLAVINSVSRYVICVLKN